MLAGMCPTVSPAITASLASPAAPVTAGSHPAGLACDPGMRSARSLPLAIAAITTAALVLAPGVARADERVDGEPKSGAAATGLAIGGTLGGFALIALGGSQESEPLAWTGVALATVGPAAGHFYAGETGHGLVTSSVRAAGITAFAVGFEMSFCLFECEQTEERRQGELLALAGLGVYAAATIYDVVDAHQAAGRANQRRAAATAAVLTTPNGHRAPGLVIAGRF
jgi:hypothetical protein